MFTLTILTPTYNRGDLLPTLYNSLLMQTCREFEWLIVDDGSTDGTEILIRKWQEDSPFFVRYIKKDNGGKHRALNIGIKETESELTFIVDSDDWLTGDAVETIKKCHERNADAGLCGYSFYRQGTDGRYRHKGNIPEEGHRASYTKCRINRNLVGDMAEVWYTRCLKEFPFPEYEGEKFLGEDIVWIRMAEKYEILFFSKAIYVSDYLPGGLTHGRRLNNLASPEGCVTRAEVFLGADIHLKYKIKPMLQYIIYGSVARYTYGELYAKTGYKLLYISLFIPACVIKAAWKNRYEV